jgi:hypothetical protein
VNDIITVKILKHNINRIIDMQIKLEYIESNLINYYRFPHYPTYFIENNNFIFSVVSNEHLEHIDNLKLNSTTAFEIITRVNFIKDLFTVYLSSLNPNIYTRSKFNKYPVGKIITEINNISFKSYEEFMNIVKTLVKSFKTIDNEIYYAE